MPIKDPQKAKEYNRLWMANKRKQQKGSVELANKLVEPKNNFADSVEPSQCSRCSELEKQLKAVATLPTEYINGLLAERDEKHQKELASIEKQIKASEQLKSENKQLKKKLAKLRQEKGGNHA